MRVIYRATKQHAFNLAKFVTLYKSFLLVQKKVNGGKARSADTFIAGLLGGYLVFGERTAINEQVCGLHDVLHATGSSEPCPDRAVRRIEGRRFFYPKSWRAVL